MALNFFYYKFEYGWNPPAVYMMEFDTGHFYIGSSKRVKTRFVLWRTQLKKNNFNSRVIRDILPMVKNVYFKLLELPKIEDLRILETAHIKKHFDDPLILNRYSNGFNKPGIKPLPTHLKKPRKAYIPKGRTAYSEDHVFKGSIPVLKFDKQGNFIEKYKSVADAARKNETTRAKIHEVVKENYSQHRGFVYKYA
jgi:hypothetical protein